MSPDAISFIRGTLEFDEDNRIGSDATGGAAAVRAHPWWNSRLAADVDSEKDRAGSRARESDGSKEAEEDEEGPTREVASVEQWDWDAMLTKQVKPPPLAKTSSSYFDS